MVVELSVKFNNENILKKGISQLQTKTKEA